MKKYYKVSVYLIKPSDFDLSAAWVWPVELIATKTLLGYRGIKTGRLIRKAHLSICNGNRSCISDVSLNTYKIKKKGAILVVQAAPGDYMPRKITNINEVKDYLSSTSEEDIFEKFDTARVRNRTKRKFEREAKRIETMESAIEALKEAKVERKINRENRKEERKLSKSISKEIKGKKGR